MFWKKKLKLDKNRKDMQGNNYMIKKELFEVRLQNKIKLIVYFFLITFSELLNLASCHIVILLRL